MLSWTVVILILALAVGSLLLNPLDGSPPSGTLPPSPTNPDSSAADDPAVSGNDLLVLVNVDHPWSGGEPANLVTISQAIPCRNIRLKNNQMQGQDQAVQALQAMADGLSQAGLGSLRITSAYRSITYQQGLFENKVRRVLAQGVAPSQAENVAAQEVTRPGTSEHHTGLAFDLVGEDNTLDSFVHTPEYQWIRENAAEYGFIIRYPEDKKEITGIIHEPWHLRYVGPEAAWTITQEGICLEEYVEKYVK